jgi:hypothetical protein
MPSGSLPGERRGGRAKGALNKKTVEQIKAIEAGGLMPLDFMLQVLRDPSLEYDIRLDAAGRAAPYCHARVAAKEPVPADDGRVHYRVTVDWISPSHSAVPYIARDPNSLNTINGHNDGHALSRIDELEKP